MSIDAPFVERDSSSALPKKESQAGGSAPFSRFAGDRMAQLDAELARADWGYFGPDSVAWRVHSHPISVVGGFRALIIQSLHPLAMAGIAQYSDFRTDPLKRFRRTAQYIHQVTFSDRATADAAAERVRKIHSKVRGTDPVTGREFSASDPETLLWVHCAEAHSFLTAYRTFVAPLSNEDQDRYLAEQVEAARLIGIPAAMVPNSRDAYREYFEKMLPTLCTSKSSAETIKFVARPDIRLVPVSEWPFAINLKFAAHAAVTLIPRTLRPIAGLPMPGVREYMLAKWTGANAKAMSHAMKMDTVADRLDSIAQRKLGTAPTPAMARRSS